MVKRGNTRKNNRRRRSNSRRNQMGGQNVSPADVGDYSMQEPSQLSMAQGKEYDAIHAEQHGGSAPLEGAPVGTTGVLDASLRDIARVSFLDQSIGDIQGMSDQSGGAKRSKRSKRKSKRSKTSKRKSKRSKTSKRKSKRSKSSKNRKTRGGGGIALEPADYSSPTHLLPASAEAKALMEMNPEWQLASNPKAFAPN